MGSESYTVVCIKEPTDEQCHRGYDGIGWYFYDDNGSLHGPFATYEDAKSLRYYCLGYAYGTTSMTEW